MSIKISKKRDGLLDKLKREIEKEKYVDEQMRDNLYLTMNDFMMN